MLLTVVWLPALAAVAAFVLRSDRVRRVLLVATAVGHSLLTGLAWLRPAAPDAGGWLGLDALGLIFLSLVSLLFLAATLYALHYLAHDARGEKIDEDTGDFFNHAPEAVFVGCLLFFLATMSLVTLSRNFGLLWVAVEATTLASAPLIYFHRSDRSLEATWKYLLLCSVGIALALLGNFFLVVAASQGASSLTLGELTRHADRLHVPWLRAAFLLLLVGYGTKMGLAPMHTWLPDAHSESPSLVSALLSGALLNCAFLGILRSQQVCVAAGQGAFGRDALVLFGLASMAVAAVFILGQADFKRLLAYSSVEHMGILALGVGLGGAGLFGAVFHAVNHSLAKGMLFLVAGNLLAAYATKSAQQVRGALQWLPVSGVLWVGGFLAITGTPPFGTFLSELMILQAALAAGKIGVAAAYLLLLAVIFAGMAAIVLRMAQGQAPESEPRRAHPGPESWLAVAPATVLLSLVLLLGLYVPPFLSQALHQAAALLGGV